MGEEVRKLLGAVRDQFVDPLLRNYPEAAGHLSSAGSEIAAALRALVRGAERQWTDHGEERPDEGRDSQQDQ
jgi:mevalonate pyrophosphate decarboxylase